MQAACQFIMNIQENKPYTPFALAMVFLALPLFTLLYDILTVWIRRQSGILWAVKHEQVYLLPLWDTGLLAMSVVGFIFNAIIALCLAKVAAQKRMRRHVRYALYLAGVGAFVAWGFAMVLSGALQLGWQKSSGVGCFCYAITVLILATQFLPKQLTLAVEQPIVFHKNTFRGKK